jgi:hypothetical protein
MLRIYSAFCRCLRKLRRGFAITKYLGKKIFALRTRLRRDCLLWLIKILGGLFTLQLPQNGAKAAFGLCTPFNAARNRRGELTGKLFHH